MDRELALVHPLLTVALLNHCLKARLCLVAWLPTATLTLPLILQRQTFWMAIYDPMVLSDVLLLAKPPAFTCLDVFSCFLLLLAMGLCHGDTPCWHWWSLRLSALVLATFTPTNMFLMLHYWNPSLEA